MGKETTEFGKLCRSYRARMGMTMAQAAGKIGLAWSARSDKRIKTPQSALTNYETNKGNLSLEFVKASMAVYGIENRKEQMEFLLAALNSSRAVGVPLDQLGALRKACLAALFTFGEVKENSPEGWDELLQWLDDFVAKLKKAKPNFVMLGPADPL
jgi:transcriptional regulator with XRE-family HTH domain